MRYLLVILLLTLVVAGAANVVGRARFDPGETDKDGVEIRESATLAAGDLRHLGVHDAGAFYTPLTDGLISIGLGLHREDPETGQTVGYASYPQGSDRRYIFGGGLWVGGIVGGDTLVTTGIDGWSGVKDFTLENPELGGMYRSNQFADDEFVTTLIDTNDVYSPIEPHVPLGIKVRHTSYSWTDSLYDDFVIINYVVENIGKNLIGDVWVGFYIDEDIYQGSSNFFGYADDCSGSLDTLLYDTDPDSRIVAAYSIDNDGDPESTSNWGAQAIRGVMSIALIDATFPIDGINFNWWLSSSNPELDYGPRQAGTPEDPLRLFANDNLGTPVTDADKYYIMSHPEIDFDQIECLVHDTSDGWVPAPTNLADDFADGSDTRFLYSFGSFDLAPGDSAAFRVALAAAEGVHVEPGDFAEHYDPLHPELYRERLDFSGLMHHLRRADTVCRSEYYLPNPGAPSGLRLVEYDDTFADVVWLPSGRGDLAGYYINIKDTAIDNLWRRAIPRLLTDTTARVSLFEPTHTYSLAISLTDTLGRESVVSLPITVMPGRPHPPESLSAILDGMVPVLTWRPHTDTAFQVYMIYRSIWNNSFELYDSTASLVYRDYGIESGLRYSYRICSTNDLGLESEATAPVQVLPMAMDQGVLFCNLNRYEVPSGGFYLRELLEPLYESVASITPTSRIDVDDSMVTFKALSAYSVVIFEAGNLPTAFWIQEDSVALFLRAGGKALIVAPAMGKTGAITKVVRYQPGNFYHEYLKLDSSVFPGVVFSGNAFVGDLVACSTLHPDYPPLEADPAKLTQTTLPVIGNIPLCGYLFPRAEVEPIYRYVSSNPDTVSHGQVNGYRYLGDDYSVVVFGFPLMPMRGREDIHALRQALRDLGVDMNCGDIDGNGAINIADILFLINYILHQGPSPGKIWNADVACSGELDMEDILVMVNYIFRGGWMNCCR